MDQPKKIKDMDLKEQIEWLKKVADNYEKDQAEWEGEEE